jgi:site-specific recombinase
MQTQISSRSEVAAGYALPDIETFCAALLPDVPRNKALRELYTLLGELEPAADLATRVNRLEALARWVRATGKLPLLEDAELAERPQVNRFRVLVRAIERFGAVRGRLQAVLGPTLSELSPNGLLARAGLPADRGLFGETMDRLSRSFLPEPVDERDLGQFVARLFPARRDAMFLSAVPPALIERFARALENDGSEHGLFAPLLHGVGDAMSLIALRVGAVGLYEAIRVRSPAMPVRSSPFFLLPRAVDEVVLAFGSGDPAARAAAKHDCLSLIAACERTVAAVIQNLEGAGVSVDVVYRLELITKNLGRLELLLDRATDDDPVERYAGAKRLLVTLLEARRNERALGQIVASNLHLLARKIIERAGETGEHYITASRSEYFKMLLSAAGGGFLTCGTTALKYLIAWAHLAPFVEGMLSAVNYAGSFIVMQFLGFTLATKQPSMTAAALAGSMRESANDKDLSGLVTTIARITRSQLAAAIGNIFVVIPTAITFDVVYRNQIGHSFLDPETATYVLASLHPTQSGTIFYAALTGVLLWVSSVGAGWLENWAVYRRLPEAIAEHRVQRFVGRRVTGYFSRVFSRNISGIGGNTTLGVLLGMTPVAGKFFGLPLDVRHVTLSTGALTLAVCTLGAEALLSPEFRAAALGIAVIGSLNFGVSFVLALLVALRAREVDRRDRFRMWASVAITFVRSPLQFILPPSAPDETPVHGPVSVAPPPVAPRDGH